MSKQIRLKGIIGVEPDSVFGKDKGFSNTTSKSLMSEIDKAIEDGESVDVLINSPGGVVFEGFEMFNEIRSREENGANIRMINNGLAASIASFLMLATKNNAARFASSMMFHEPSKVIFLENLDRTDMRINKEEFDVTVDTLAEIMTNKNGFDLEVNKAIISRTTWFGAKDAFVNNLVDEIVDGDIDSDKFKETEIPVDLFQNISLNCKRRHFESQNVNNKEFDDCNSIEEINELLWTRIS